MKRTGEILKTTRESKGISLSEVALSTKINAKILEAMEAGEIGRLPQKAFVRGFVQTYARYLGLDTQKILDVFQEEMGPTKSELPTPDGPMVDERPSGSLNLPPPDGGTTFASRKFVLGALGAILVAAIIFTVQLVQKYERESQLPAESEIAETAGTISTGDSLTADLTVAGDSLSGEPTPSSTADGTTPTTLEAVSKTTSTTLRTTTSTTVRTTSSTLRATTSTTVKTTSSTLRATTTTIKITTTTLRSVTTTSLAQKAGNPFEVVVEALDQVTIKFNLDGVGVKEVQLAPEQVQIFKAKRSLTLDVSNGGAISIIYNGIDRGQPGNLGKPASIKFP